MVSIVSTDGEIDFTHSTRADLFQDLVVGEGAADHRSGLLSDF